MPMSPDTDIHVIVTFHFVAEMQKYLLAALTNVSFPNFQTNLFYGLAPGAMRSYRESMEFCFVHNQVRRCTHTLTPIPICSLTVN